MFQKKRDKKMLSTRSHSQLKLIDQKKMIVNKMKVVKEEGRTEPIIERTREKETVPRLKISVPLTE